MKQTLTRSKGGTAEREVQILSLDVPDLWHLAMWLKDQKNTKGAVNRPDYAWFQMQADMVLDCWSLAHDMKRMLQEMLPREQTEK